MLPKFNDENNTNYEENRENILVRFELDSQDKNFLNSKLVDEAKFITFFFLCFRGLRAGRASLAVVGSAPVSGLSPSQQDASAKGEKAWAAHVDRF